MKRPSKAVLVSAFKLDVLAVAAEFQKIVVEHKGRGLKEREMFHAYIDAVCDVMGMPK